MTRLSPMTWLSVALGGLLATTVGAAEVELPQAAQGPTTALAKAENDGDEIVVVLRVVDTQQEYRKTKSPGRREAPVLREELPPNVTVQVMVERQTLVEVPKRFRTIRVPAKAFSLQRANGKAIATDQLPALLNEETPVLLNFETSVDAFHLLTVREETLILSTRREAVFPATASLPPLPVPPNAPQLLPKPEVSIPIVR